jgi:hypothetical protein
MITLRHVALGQQWQRLDLPHESVVLYFEVVLSRCSPSLVRNTLNPTSHHPLIAFCTRLPRDRLVRREKQRLMVDLEVPMAGIECVQASPHPLATFLSDPIACTPQEREATRHGIEKNDPNAHLTIK